MVWRPPSSRPLASAVTAAAAAAAALAAQLAGAGCSVGYGGNSGCTATNVAAGVGVVTRSGSSCGRVRGSVSVRNVANGGKGGRGGNGGKGNAVNRF